MPWMNERNILFNDALNTLTHYNNGMPWMNERNILFNDALNTLTHNKNRCVALSVWLNNGDEGEHVFTMPQRNKGS